MSCLPLVMVIARLLALPGMHSLDLIGFDVLRQFGDFLNLTFTLEWMPPAHRRTILYLLMLPSALLMITFVQLTFGIRVLGIRAIVISVGFHKIGIIPSLALMIVIVVIILLVRPVIRHIRLPSSARLSLISCIVAIIMVAALFVGPWMRSETIWSLAFFPVIMLALLAEGIAKIIDQDNALVASWRLGATVILALLILLVTQSPTVQDFALHFPELMLTQLAAIILISEFLDFRLLHNWQANLGKYSNGAQEKLSGQIRIAVVRNRRGTDIIGYLGNLAPEKNRFQSVQQIVDALRDEGFTVKVYEGDTSLLRKLRGFLPPNPQTLEPGGLVLNLATGIQGNSRFSHLPSMLEMSGIAYTGPDPIGHTCILDRYILMSLLQRAGVLTPRFKLMCNRYSFDDINDIGDLQFPLVVRPRCEPDAPRRIVKNCRELSVAVHNVLQQYAQDAFVETFYSSPEIRVALLGNGTIECLPLLQVNFESNGERICPAPIASALAGQVRECAQRAYIAAGCRDYARIDIRLNHSGEPCVVDILSLKILARRGTFVQAAEVGGYSFQSILCRIVEVAWERYAIEPGTWVSQNNICSQQTPRLLVVKEAVK